MDRRAKSSGERDEAKRSGAASRTGLLIEAVVAYRGAPYSLRGARTSSRRLRMTQPPTSSRRPSASPHLPGSLARLRAEQLATKDAVAHLLHELGVGQEPFDEAAATRDYLAAFNADPRFREPLEALVRLFSRRSSAKNLGKLLDALVRTAATPDEKARAHWLRGTFVLDHLGDPSAAQQAFQAILEERPDDPTAWLELELLAAKRGDVESRVKALEARSSLVRDPNWRGLLLLDRAELESERGHVDVAFELLDSARKLPGVARYAALQATESLGLREARHARVAEALEARAELIADAIDEPNLGELYGVPHGDRRPETIADAWLRASEARRRAGDPKGAASNLDRALAHLPDHIHLRLLQLDAAHTTGDDDRVARLAENLIEAGVPPRLGASLWFQLADAVRTQDRGLALDAANKALELDPKCIPASVLRLELLAGRDDSTELAAALEARAEALDADQAKAGAYLLAAFVHAFGRQDAAPVKAALSRAASLGAPPSLLARTARLTASLMGSSTWLEESMAQLAEATESPSERASLSFELARQRLMQRALPSAHEAIVSLAEHPGTRWLGDMLLAYAEPALQPVDSPPGRESLAALDRLRENEPRRELADALAIVAAIRADALGDEAGAKSRLSEIDDDLAAMYLADLERRNGNVREAARHLARAAELTLDDELAAALRIEAFVLAHRAGDQATATLALSSARPLPDAAKRLIAWALRGAAPDELAQRVRALELGAEVGENETSMALERFGLLEPNATEERVRDWLGTIEREGSADFGLAGVLAGLIARTGDADHALKKLASRSREGAALAAYERLQTARAQGEPDAIEDAARAWAQADPSLAPALEWLGASFAKEDPGVEVLAREQIASRLDDLDRSAVLASAAAVALAHSPAANHPPLDSTQIPSRLMNLELAPPGSDPRRRAQALAGFDGVLGADAEIDALLLAGQNHLAAGDAAAALLAFQQVTEARPDEIWAWEGVKAAAEALEDPKTFALACAHLGELCLDDQRGAEHWERAGLVLLERLNETERAEFALEQAFLRDPHRNTAFDRLFRRVREAGQHEKLLSLITRRLEVADDPAELAKLFWEQARSLRQQGHREAALAALESVTAIEPDHLGALALSGEIFITQGQYAEAAQALSRLASLPDAPDQQRLMSGIAAVDLYENKLGDSIRALEVLVGLHEARLSTLPVRERLARAAAKTESWLHAASIFEELMNDRPTREGRIEAARLAMALWRDKLGMPERAEKAVTKLLDEAPGDAEAIDVTLESPFEPAIKRKLLTNARDLLLAGIQKNPADAAAVTRLAGVARALGDLPLRQAALGAQIALGHAPPAADTELGELDARVATTPQVALDEATLARVADPEDTGPIARLFELIAAPVGEALGPSLSALGVGKKDRLDPRGGFPVRNEIAAWAGALGLPEVTVYIGGPDPECVQGVAGDNPAIVVGTAVRAPLHPRHRQAIARELFALRRGIGVVRTRDETTVAALVVAACNIAGVPIDAPPYALLADVQRQLSKTLPRRTRKLLPEVCREIASSGQDPKRWARAAQLSMHRMAAIAAGDVSIVLADWLGQPRQQISAARHERARRLIAFVLSPDYLELRERLGMGIS